MNKNYTDEELKKIEESVDKFPEHVKHEVFNKPPEIELPKVKKDKVKKKNIVESSDASFMVPPPMI